ncbi:MAG: HesA/MoeB/ThiF family protein [Cypionkella sp.]|uniref:HesA/MoeB/ThiF family protein n=1 Tax=Cypionkella sp. TaxID=2811411 RepID=UPI002ABA6AD5|nr:HesA/MoeB/ThiF family protein [Cypionkella sp.]MDZ4310500.1 HesA/MoeB/ThiF family protein [Cypionkella sp.]
MSRYIRQTVLAEIGVAGQQRLAEAKVLVVGAGGLAAALLPLLAGAGVGQITVLDPDLIEDHNLHRQTFFTTDDLGKPKALVMALRLLALNPDIWVTAHCMALTPENADDLVAQADVVVDAADSLMATYVLSDQCLSAGVPLISASVQGMAGYAGGFCASAPSYRALFPDPPGGEASCATAGVMGPVAALLGACQAQMVLAQLLGLAASPLGQLVRFDLTNYRSSTIRFDVAREPTSFPPFLSPRQLTPQDRVYDVRDACEAPVIADFAQRLGHGVNPIVPENGRLVFGCRSGLRAWRLANLWAAQGVTRLGLMAFAP